jgi:hypothetical protein
MKSKICLKGHGYFERRRKDGTKIDSWECDNLIVTTGKEQVAKLLNGVDLVYFNTIAIGEGATAPAIGQEALVAEVKRIEPVLAYEVPNKATFEYTFVFASLESYAITEAGIFNDSSAGGIMLDRFTFTEKDVDADTDLYVKITITVV